MKSIKIVFSFLLFIIISCTNPLDKAILQHAKDNIPPIISIISPTDGSPFSSTVVVTGTVKDISSPDHDNGKVSEMWFEVLGTNIKDNIAFQSDGFFSFQFETTNLSGHITIKITAVDWNGNQSDISLTLYDAGSGIPNFSVTPGNHSVTLTWEPVPLAKSYTLFYTENEGVPSATYGNQIDNLTSPYTLNNLENGAMHVFLLQAHSSSGEDNWSELKRAIPLSHFSLVPRLQAKYKKIVLEWPKISGTDEFYVLRAISRDGSYNNISGTLNTNRYEDTDVQDNQLYYYKIVPSLPGSIESFPVQGMANIFPASWIEMKGVLAQIFTNYSSVAVSGNYFYTTEISNFFGSGPVYFSIYDISNPEKITLTGRISDFAPARSMVVRDSTVYVATTNEIRLIDISDPINPILSDTYTGCSDIHGIDVVGNITYVADGAGGLKIYDPADPSFPLPVVIDASPDSANDVAVYNGYAYIAVGASGVDVVDLSTNTIITTSDTDGNANALVTDGSYLYVADDTSGLSVIDISNPSLASVVGTCATLVNAVDISLTGNLVCIADGTGGLVVINISDPTFPFITGFDDSPTDAVSIAADGDTVCVVDDSSSFDLIEAYKLNDYRPRAVNSATTNFDGNMGLAFNDKYIFAGANNSVSGNDDIKIIDSLTYSVVNTYSTDYFDVSRFIVIGDYLFFGSTEEMFGDGRMNILDISKAPDVSLISYFDFNSVLFGSVISGDYCFAVGSSGIIVLDISNPQKPVQIGYLSLPGISVDIDISGHYAYIASYTAGLQVVDISNPHSPTKVTSLNIPNLSYSVATTDSYAYVGIKDASNNGVFKIVDITNPSNPQVKGSINLDNDPTDMVVEGTYVYAMCEGQPLYIINVADASNPLLSEILGLSFQTFPGMIIYGNKAYTVSTHGLEILNLMGGN